MRALGQFVLAFFRPWPLQPIVAIPMALVTGLWSATVVLTSEAAGQPSPPPWQTLASIVLPAGVIAIALAVARRYVGQYQTPSWPLYYAIIVGTAALAVAVRFALLWDSAAYLSDARPVILYDLPLPAFGFIRAVVGLLMFTSLLGWFTRRLSAEAQRAEEALQVVRVQQQRLVAADEATRRQIAADLHDRIQSSLLLVGMQVQQIAQEAEPDTSGRLKSIADELEYIRGKRLHDVIDGLSPDYPIVGLTAALSTLGARYSTSMQVDIDLDPQAVALIEADLAWTEAVYRIVEQALMNSMAHGRAACAQVRLCGQERILILSIDDDGSCVDGSMSPGLGTAITDAWAGRTHGQWTRATSDDGGTCVRVEWRSAP
ncbi:MAG: sensor histidine kinase [Chthoniobacterales bacterium]